MSLLTWSNFEKASTILGLLGSFAAFLAWIQARIISRNVTREKERLDQEIKIILQGEDENHIIQLPFALRRRELIRSELLGLIGMLPTTKEKERFAIRFLSKGTFRELMSKMQDAEEESVMIIPCTNEEINQFAVGRESYEES